MAQIQKKTSTMSVTISSCSRETSSYSSSSSSASSTTLQQSSLVQPVCISPQRTVTPCQYSGNGGTTPTFIKRLHDVSTVKGQLVVLECRIRGTPPLNVCWYREDEQIPDSADFRILRKKASSTSIPEELCTLVITEAYPEDSGIFKCITSNQFGTASCSAVLEVYTDIDEVLADVDGPDNSESLEQDTPPLLLQDVAAIPPPEWPDSPEEDPAAETPPMQKYQSVSGGAEMSCQFSSSSSKSITTTSSSSQITTETPTSPQRELHNTLPKPFTPTSKQKSLAEPGSTSKNLADLPTFSPTLFSPCAFNYERPRHFIQSQPSFQTPSYDSLQSNGSSNPSPYSSTLSSPTAATATPTASAATSSQPPASPPQPAPPPAPMRTSVTLIPRVSRSQCGNEEKISSADFLCSVLPSNSTPTSTLTPQARFISVPRPQSQSSGYIPNTPTKTSPQPPPPQSQPIKYTQPSPTPPPISPKLNTKPAALPQHSSLDSQPFNYRETPKILPKPILKKTISQPVVRSTDQEIQGSKDALIQDLEKKLRSKEARQKNNQKLSYEERMARRLLGRANAASVFDFEDSAEFQHKQMGSVESQQSGGMCSSISKLYTGGEVTEGSAIQEKCYAPRFIQVPEDLIVEEGRFCRIDFKVGGLPAPDVTWYLDGKAIRPDDYHKMLVCEKGVHSFIIEIVTVHHAGVYECIARNRAGEARFSLRLDVIAQEVQRPPSFVVKMQNLRVLEGDMVRLECKVSASPSPQIFWKKDKEMLRIDPMRMSLSNDSSGNQCLIIDRVVKSDAGWYTVSAINEAGLSTCNARLDVATRVNKTGTPVKPVKMLPIINQFSSLGSESSPRHTAPLYESEEL
ncbi:myotilin isoform X1 [Astyanax mexicanus]|uniref:myotilin isoform X1 n=1 Tax=Astyanax mexicanus TaxID=7994 RepID=UPI0020CACC28|nr:myotilin isoform X1 [Astyanax mexicanus]XP_049340090.1 myotilin isoform X1 [Astyanax mexicanus]